jgi:hypothetical protein
MIAVATKLKTAKAVQNYRHQAATNLKVTYELSPSYFKKKINCKQPRKINPTLPWTKTVEISSSRPRINL